MKQESPDSDFRALFLLFVFASAWLLWSGIFKPLVLFLGAVSCLMTLFLAKRIKIIDSNPQPVNFNLGFLTYWLWLGKEMIKSSIDVARVIINPNLPISPRTLEIDVSELSPADQVILGNSITLTPGTLALDVHENTIRVHSLTKAAADDLTDGGAMLQKVRALH